MQCVGCYNVISEGDKFCKYCGLEVKQLIKLRCTSCGATLTSKTGGKFLYCPYCGEKSIMPESDAVKIEQIRNNTKIKKYESKMYMNDKEVRIEQEKTKQEKNGFIFFFALIAFLFLFSEICMLFG